jgi:hypothetical protein
MAFFVTFFEMRRLAFNNWKDTPRWRTITRKTAESTPSRHRLSAVRSSKEPSSTRNAARTQGEQDADSTRLEEGFVTDEIRDEVLLPIFLKSVDLAVVEAAHHGVDGPWSIPP